VVHDRLDSLFCDELRLKPWQFPAVEQPDAKSPYPPG
jgi:hypothetical protein